MSPRGAARRSRSSELQPGIPGRQTTKQETAARSEIACIFASYLAWKQTVTSMLSQLSRSVPKLRCLRRTSEMRHDCIGRHLRSKAPLWKAVLNSL